MRYEVRFAGFGGQGIVAAAYILGYAASMFEGKNVVQTQSYGPEARGGSSRGEVVISNEEIDYPLVLEPDALVCFNQGSYVEYGTQIRENGVILIESDLVSVDKNRKIHKGVKMISIPATKLAETKLFRRQVANMVMLGALIGATKIILLESAEHAVEVRWPRFAELNKKALRLGAEYVQNQEG